MFGNSSDSVEMTASNRKQVYELTADDLRQFPVWEFALDEEGDDGQDEATIRPFPSEDIEDRLDGSLVVAATFELADGTCLPGYLTPRNSDARTLGDLQPQIITDRGQVMFWYGRCPLQTSIPYEKLNRASNQVFPVRFQSLVGSEISKCVGEIPGFCCLNDDFETFTVRQ